MLAIVTSLRPGSSVTINTPADSIDHAAKGPPTVMADSQPGAAVIEVPTPALSRRQATKRATPRQRMAVPQNEVVSFVPIVPMTADELSGSFSIARVQIGGRPADVLLGEDGMARAIRVSTDGSAPWRSR